jgi:WD40 repeat protein
MADGSVALFDGRGRLRQTLTAHVDEVRDIVVSPRGGWAATGDAAGEVTVWNVDPRSGRWSHREGLAGHEAGLAALTLSADGRQLVSFAEDGSGIVWDMSAAGGLGHPRRGLGDRWMSNRPAVVVPGRLIVAPTRSAPTTDTEWWSQRNVSATFLDPRTGQVVDQVPVGENQGYLFGSSAATSPDRSLVAVTYGLGTKVLDARTRSPVATIELPDVLQNDESAPEAVWCSGWTPDGRRLLLCADGLEDQGGDGNLVVVDTRTWEVAEERVDVGGAVQTIEVSPDTELIAIGMAPPLTGDPPPGLVKLLDSTTLEVVGTIELDDTQFPFDVAWSPSGDRLAIGLQNGMLAVADVRTRKLVHPPARMSRAFVTQVEWLPDGESVAVAGADGTVSLYDTRRGLLRATLPVGHVKDFALTHILSFTDHSITAVVGERRARTFSLDPDRWLDRACTVAGRDLTRDEWASYLPGREYERTCTDRR